MATTRVTRRSFLTAGSALGGGLMIGLLFPRPSGPGRARWRAEAAGRQTTFAPNAWIRIAEDGRTTLVIDKSEMGQGVATALPMLIAEELDVDLGTVKIEESPAYAHPPDGEQITDGSASVRRAFDPLRQAGATARAMLVSAAAQTWGIPEARCRTSRGEVIDAVSGRRLGYGQLARRAADLPVPRRVRLKTPAEWRLIGRPVPRTDTPLKVNGTATFGIDVAVPGMRVAVVARCPTFDGRAVSYQAAKARAVSGVRAVVPIASGIAVVADSFWAAKQGRDALEPIWDKGPNGALSSAGISSVFAGLAAARGVIVREQGDPERALARAAKRLRAVYEVPFLAHATMEPMNCTASVRPDACEVWVPTQAQTRALAAAARITGLPPEKITIHTTFLGGGFGRRLEADYVAEAVEISKAVEAPVKVLWTREDDIQHDFYRPATYNVLEAGLDSAGTLLAWTHRIVGPSILARWAPEPEDTLGARLRRIARSSILARWIPGLLRGAVDSSSVEVAAALPYGIPHIGVDYVMHDAGVPVGNWRSVGGSQNGFVVESFIDEVAAAAGWDPLQFRRKLLAHAPRHRAVLERAAAKAGWETPAPPGIHRGIAVVELRGSYAAMVAEVSVTGPGPVRVHRIVGVLDCGTVVNPDTVIAQTEGGIAFGLTAALKGGITIRDGAVAQHNFYDYQLLRLNEVPVIEVEIVPSHFPPGGVGEVATPPVAPAVANAVFAATGRRARTLPILSALLPLHPARNPS